MKDVDGAFGEIAKGRKPKRYFELYMARFDRKISLESMMRICYAIGSVHRETGIVRTDRAVGIKPGTIKKDATADAKKAWWTKFFAYQTPTEENEQDQEWIEQIEANMGDACELTEEEERWVNYLQEIPHEEKLPI